MTYNVTFRGLVNNKEYTIIMEYYAAVGTVLSFTGVVSNIINIRTFIVMGISDGITVSFLALSIFDLAYLVSSFSLGISVSLGVIELRHTTRFPVDPYAVSMILANVMILLNVTNVLTTTFLAVARCMCVAKPLNFKNTFTRRRTTGFIIGFAIFAVASYMPVLATMAIVPLFDKKNNLTRPALWVARDREAIKIIVWVLLDMVLPTTTQFVILVCVLVMASSLRAASRFRQSSVSASTIEVHKANNTEIVAKKTKNNSNSHTNTTDKLADKSTRVVQQVVLISLVYVICNTPKILISVIQAIASEFAPGQRYNNLYLNVNTLRKHFEAFNAAINTAIYYKYNSKFRKAFGF